MRALALILLLSGCTSFDKLAQILAKDPNAICIKQSSIYESFIYDHNWGCESPPTGK